jgi:hypothetical protein
VSESIASKLAPTKSKSVEEGDMYKVAQAPTPTMSTESSFLGGHRIQELPSQLAITGAIGGKKTRMHARFQAGRLIRFLEKAPKTHQVPHAFPSRRPIAEACAPQVDQPDAWYVGRLFE